MFMRPLVYQITQLSFHTGDRRKVLSSSVDGFIRCTDLYHEQTVSERSRPLLIRDPVKMFFLQIDLCYDWHRTALEDGASASVLGFSQLTDGN